MATTILYNEESDKYNIYCSIADNFYFLEGCTEDQLYNWYIQNAIKKAKEEFVNRTDRAKKAGHSSRIYAEGQTKDLLSINRAGKDGDTLSYEECVKRFLS